MVWVRCPRCTLGFQAAGASREVCPACGFQATLRPEHMGPVNPPARDPPRHPTGLYGKPRRTSTVLLLTVLTLGLYGYFFLHHVYREADAQHGRRLHWFLFGMGCLPIVGLPWAIAYLFKENARLQAYRRRHGLRSGFGWAGYTLWTAFVPGLFLLALVPMALLNRSATGLWQVVYAGNGLRLPPWARPGRRSRNARAARAARAQHEAGQGARPPQAPAA